MTPRPRLLALALGALALAAPLSGCGGDDDGSDDTVLLHAGDFDDVSSIKAASLGIAGSPWCQELVDVQDRLNTSTGHGERQPVGTDAVLGKATEVYAVVITPGDLLATTDAMTKALDQAVTACEKRAATPRFEKMGVGIKPLQGLPYDALGYRLTSGDGETQDRAYAVTPDHRLLAVGSLHSVEGDPQVPVSRLLDLAMGRLDEPGGD